MLSPSNPKGGAGILIPTRGVELSKQAARTGFELHRAGLKSPDKISAPKIVFEPGTGGRAFGLGRFVLFFCFK
jgi:hypothetical protein